MGEQQLCIVRQWSPRTAFLRKKAPVNSPLWHRDPYQWLEAVFQSSKVELVAFKIWLEWEHSSFAGIKVSCNVNYCLIQIVLIALVKLSPKLQSSENKQSNQPQQPSSSCTDELQLMLCLFFRCILCSWFNCSSAVTCVSNGLTLWVKYRLCSIKAKGALGFSLCELLPK